MKRLVSLGLLVTLAGLAIAAPDANSLLSAAKAKAKKENKAVFLSFHASWCGWCHKLEGLMDKGDFAPMFDKNYVLLGVDVQEQPEKKSLETPGGEALMESLGGKDKGLPFYVIIDPKGSVLASSLKDGENIGFPAAPEEIAHFSAMLKKSAKRMSPADYAALEAKLKTK